MNHYFEEGYDAGLVNDRSCPYSMLDLYAYLCWQSGNDVGVRIHCAIVESVYLSEEA